MFTMITAAFSKRRALATLIGIIAIQSTLNSEPITLELSEPLAERKNNLIEVSPEDGENTAVKSRSSVSALPAPGNCISFDGARDGRDYLTVPQTSELYFGDGESFTIEFWMNQDSRNNLGDNVIIANKAWSSSDIGWFIGTYRDSSGCMTFQLTTSTKKAKYVRGGTNVADSTWHHVAIVYDSVNDTGKIYVDGALDASGTFQGNGLTAATDNKIHIGRTSDISRDNAAYRGKLDDLRIWRGVRTAAEIQANMNNELFYASLPDNLALYYQFNEDGLFDGSTLFDLTDNANNASMVGFKDYGPQDKVWNPSFAMGGPALEAASAYTSSSAMLHWRNPVASAGVYALELQISLDPEFESLVSYPAGESIAPSSTSFEVTGLTPGVAYFARLVAKSSEFSLGERFSNVIGLTIPVDVHPGKALEFDGVDDMIVTTPNFAKASSNLTFSAWIKRETGQSGMAPLFFSQSNVVASNNYIALYLQADGTLAYLWNSTSLQSVPSLTIPENTWVHVAAVFSSSNNFFYVTSDAEGTQVASNNIGNSSSELFGSAYIGGIPTSVPNPDNAATFKGAMDEVQLFKSALTEADVKTLASSIPNLNNPIGDSIFHFQFDHAMGNYAVDMASSGYAVLCDGATVGQGAQWIDSSAVTSKPIVQTSTNLNDNGFTINWLPVAADDTADDSDVSYKVEIYELNGELPIQSASTSQTSFSFTISPYGIYEYAVTANISTGTSLSSDRHIVTTGMKAPGYSIENVDTPASFKVQKTILGKAPDEFTIEFWLKPTQFRNSSFMLTAQPGNGSQQLWKGFTIHGMKDQKMYVGTTSANNNDRLIIEDAFDYFGEKENLLEITEPDGNGFPQVVGYAPNPSAVMWQHFAITFNRGTIKVYRNGNLIGEKERIPASTSWAQLDFTQIYGELDEFRVWSKAYSSDEILENMTSKVETNSPNLELYYRFDQIELNSEVGIPDLSGRGLHASFESMLTRPSSLVMSPALPPDSTQAEILIPFVEISVDEETLLALQINTLAGFHATQPLFFTILDSPEGAVINRETGLLTWTPSERQDGVHRFNILVTHGDEIDYQYIVVSVNDVNKEAPVIEPIESKSVDEETPVTFTVTATDHDIPTNLYYSLESAPDGATINSATGDFSWLPSENQSGTHSFNAVVSDGELATSATINITVNEVNLAPSLHSVEHQQIIVNKPFVLNISSSDSDIPANKLTYSLANSPTGMIIDSQRGEIRWTPIESQIGVHQCEVAVSDGKLVDTEHFTIRVYSDFESGNGTPENPYQIATLAQLRRLSEIPTEWDKHFLLTADIDASDTQNWNIGDHDNNNVTPDMPMGFSPIGNYTTKFTGGFDGQDHMIQSLKINRPYDSYVGLFGCTEKAKLTKVKLSSCTIAGCMYVGGLVGMSNTSSVIKCRAEGNISGVSSTAYTGGLIGYTYFSSINNCFADCIVNGNSNLGGLIGISRSSAIKNCYSMGNVTGNYGLGGLIGIIDSSDIYNCYSITTGDGNSQVGGLAGKVHNLTLSSLNECYWDIDSTRQTESAGSDPSFGLTSAEFLAKDFRQVWNFGTDDDNPWYYFSENSYPKFYWQDHIVQIGSIGAVSVNQGKETKFTVTADESYHTDKLSFSLAGDVPTGATINSITGEFSWTPSVEQGGHSFTFSIQATDGNQNDSETLSMTVNRPPVLDAVGNKTTAEEATLSFNVTASDPGSASANLYYGFLGDVPNGAVLDRLTGAFTWTPAPVQEGAHTITIQVSDGFLVDTEQIVIKVNDSIMTQGYGTTDEPFQISTPEQLVAIGLGANYWDDHFVITADLDMTGHSLTPIGTSPDPFTGTFDGGNHTISNISMNLPQGYHVALFGRVNGSKLTNVKLQGVDVVGQNHAASLIALCDNSTVKNCHAENVNASAGNYGESLGGLIAKTSESSILDCTVKTIHIDADADAGGLIGRSDSSSTQNCRVNDGEIRVTEIAGGLIGINNSSQVYSCHAKISVCSQSTSGGLVGSNTSSTIINCSAHGATEIYVDSIMPIHTGGLVGGNSNGKILNSYASGPVSAYRKPSSYISGVGGLIGSNWSNYVVTNCYSTGSVTNNSNTHATFTGGLFGWNFKNASLMNSYSTGRVNTTTKGGGISGYNTYATSTKCYWDKDISGMSNGDNSNSTSNGLATEEFLKHDFSKIWELGDSDDKPWVDPGHLFYPVLYWQKVVTAPFRSNFPDNSITVTGWFNSKNIIARDYGFQFSTDKTFATATTGIVAHGGDGGDGVFQTTLSDLTTGTIYYYRAFAAGADGILHYGQPNKFYTWSSESILEDSEAGREALLQTLLTIGLGQADPNKIAQYQQTLRDNVDYLGGMNTLHDVINSVNNNQDIIFYELEHGWNLVHVPMATPVFSHDSFPCLAGQSWTWNSQHNAYDAVDSLEYGSGSWIFWDADSGTTPVAGVLAQQTRPSPTLQAGWNLVGSWDGTALPTEIILGIWAWDCENSCYIQVSAEDVEKRQGYWIFCDQ